MRLWLGFVVLMTVLSVSVWCYEVIWRVAHP